MVLKGHQIVIPPSLRDQYLADLHSGHQGYSKAEQRAKATIYWPNMLTDLKDYIQRCPTCILDKKPHAEPLLPHEVPLGPWKKVGMDFFDHDGQKYLLVIDYFSKFPFCYPVPSTHFRTIQQRLDELFSVEGYPAEIFSDNGPPFGSEAFHTYCQQNNMTHSTLAPYNPRSNGMAEAHVKIMKQALTRGKQHGQTLPQILAVLRSTPISRKLPSPAEILHGRPATGNLPMAKKPKRPSDTAIRRILMENQRVMKANYDRRTKATALRDLMPGEDAFYLANLNNNKENYHRGRIVEKIVSERSYKIRTAQGKTLRCNRMHIRPISPTSYRAK